MLPCSEISSPKSGQTARRAFPGWGMVRRASSLWSTNPTPHGDELTEGGDPPTKRFRGTSPTDDNTHSVQHLCVYPGQRDGWDPSSISFHWRGRSCRRKGSRADFRPQVDQSKAPFAEHPLDPITADPLRLRGSFVRRRGTGPGDVCRGGAARTSALLTRCDVRSTPLATRSRLAASAHTTELILARRHAPLVRLSGDNPSGEIPRRKVPGCRTDDPPHWRCWRQLRASLTFSARRTSDDSAGSPKLLW